MLFLRSLLGTRNSTRRVVAVVVIVMICFIVTGFFYHNVVGQTIAGIITLSLLLSILPMLNKKNSKSGLTTPDRDEATTSRKPIDNRSQEI
jgi:hypothetical protein